MTIKFADQRIREARQRIAALNREMAQVPRAFPSLQPNDPIVKVLRAERVRLADERTKACLELMELLELDEMPTNETRHHASPSP